MKKIGNIFILFAIVLIIWTCDKPVLLEPPEKLPTTYGKVFIDSKPSNAEIYLAGRNTGFRTPDTISWLNKGDNTFMLKEGLFGDTTFVLDVTADSIRHKYIDFTTNPNFYGSIYCTSKPVGSKIYMNNSFTENITPYTFENLLPGNYKFKFTYPEHRPDSASVTLYGSQKQVVSLILEDTSKWVSYKVSNSNIPSNTISSIVIDKQNKIWVGTRDKGVAQFDNKTWKTYTTKNSQLISDFVYCMKVDNDNALWIGTGVGLSIFKNGVWQSFSQEYLHKYITDIAIGKNGVVWVATEVGLAKYDSGNWVLYTNLNSGIPGNFVTCVDIDQNGNVWLGTSVSGISKYDGTTWDNYKVERMGIAPTVGDLIRHIAVDKNNNVWVSHAVDYKAGFVGGLTKFNGSGWSLITYPDVLTTLIESIFVDNDNTVWIGTAGGLTEVTELGELTNYTSQNSQIPLGRVSGVAIDGESHVWISTLSNGITKYKR